MEREEFRKRAHEMVDWMADYYEHVEQYPVKSQVKPGEIIKQLPQSPPKTGESFDTIFADFQKVIMPGITHWQHPSFFAYFNANTSFPSLLGEMLTAALGAQCMSWQTSPAATELEERVMEWVAELIGLPVGFTGVIQDTASTATMCALISAREKLSQFAVNKDGLFERQKFIVYCSTEAHSSIEKAVKAIGIGKENLRKVPVDRVFALIPEKLAEMVQNDLAAGYVPMAVVSAFGTTGSTAIDPLAAIGLICQRYGLWLHVDAAYAGTALLLPEKRDLLKGIEMADSFVFNPHKWMFTNFDCSVYYVKSKEVLIRSFEILPEYLKTKEGEQVNNYRDWGIQLGRRFRALKLWFVIRSYGVAGLQEKIRGHIKWAERLAADILGSPDFELLAPVPFATVCFRFRHESIEGEDALDKFNQKLMETLNDSGKIYLTHTKLNGMFTLRLVIGQTFQQERHVRVAWRLIKDMAYELL